MDSKQIENEYKFQCVLVANVLKKQAMHIVKALCREITAPHQAPYKNSEFYVLIKKELKLSKFEVLLPKLTQFSESEYSKWRTSTHTIIANPDSYAQKVLDELFKEYPELKEGLVRDMELSKTKIEDRLKSVYIVVGSVGLVSLVGAFALSFKK